MGKSNSIEVKYRNVGDLIKYENNSRTHSDEQINQIAASINEFGFVNPILVDGDSVIIAGHGRLMAAQVIGMEKVPVICLSHLSPKQARALVIADNRLALNAGWDEDALAAEIGRLDDEGFDLDLLGFEEDELQLFIDDEEPDREKEESTPEVQDRVKTALGDVWQMGEHRLMCGDSTSGSDIENLLTGVKTDLLFTDPPYGMSYGVGRAKGEHSLDKKTGGVKVKAHGMIKGDDLSGDELLQMVADSIGGAMAKAKEGAAAYICFTWRTYSEFYAALASANLEPKACIVWDKKSIGLGNSNYRPQHEFIFYCAGQWYGDKSQPDVWYLSRGATGDYVHPTQKPVELVEKAIKNSSKRGDIVHDAFGGSGTTLIACERVGRVARLMELDPQYCDVIVRRWQEYAGESAVRESDGVAFDDAEIVDG